MEADHREAAAGLEPRHRRGKAALDCVEFAVHVDAQGLETARRRVLVGLAPAERALDQLSEFERARDRLFIATPLHDRARNTATLLLFAVAPEHIGDLRLVGA